MAPRATYRLQLGKDLGFAQAGELAPYLAGLGISHVYLSPHLQAAAGSTHGYDVIDHGRVSSELGGEAEHSRMLTAFARHGLSVVVDVVPNHMSIARADANPWWWDVLENGRDSRWAGFFDIDWDHSRILLPVLGDQYGRVLEAGEISIVRKDGQDVVKVHDHLFPLSPQTRAAPPRDLHELLEQQHYRLAYWKSARYDLDYRRFFDVNELVGLRMDRPEVFEATHALVLRWVDEGLVTGLRIDHPDGLVDPLMYLQRLRERAPKAWIVVEKILAHDETLPASWPVQGTTGYDFANRVCGLWIDGSSAKAFSDLYQELTGAADPSFAPVATTRKRRILRDVLGSDVRRVLEHFMHECEKNLAYRDTSREEMRRALENVLVALPVYRTYVRAGEPVSPQDRAVIGWAVARAKEQCSDCDGRLFDLIERLLLGDPPSEAMRRFQQLSGPVAAKGVEDTAFFDHHRFIALNDVGNDPDRFGTSAAELHAFNAAQQRAAPLAMLATSTHDSKRSEDVRARLAVLSEMPDDWRRWVLRMRETTKRFRGPLVDAAIEYHLYQTLAGAMPISGERLAGYLTKAMREAKDRTSWLAIDAAYEDAVQTFAATLLADAEAGRLLAALHTKIAPAGEENALALKLLALTSPGVPDLYQGSERSFYALTDPDNRRPVDYALPDDRKTALVRKALAVRREHAPCFDERGSYTPMFVEQPRLVAFQRGERVLVITSRLRLTPLDIELDLPAGTWLDVLGEQRYSGRIAWRSATAMLLIRG